MRNGAETYGVARSGRLHQLRGGHGPKSVWLHKTRASLLVVLTAFSLDVD